MQSVRNNAHKLTILRPFSFKLYVAVSLGEKRVVPTNADIGSRMETRTALANQDIACNDRLTTIELDAQSFTF